MGRVRAVGGSLFGHPDVRLMDGGRAKWIAEGRPLTTDEPKRPRTDYPVIERDDSRSARSRSRSWPTWASR